MVLLIDWFIENRKLWTYSFIGSEYETVVLLRHPIFLKEYTLNV